MLLQKKFKIGFLKILFPHPEQSIKITLSLSPGLDCYISGQDKGSVVDIERICPVFQRPLQLDWDGIDHHFCEYEQFDQLLPLQGVRKNHAGLCHA